MLWFLKCNKYKFTEHKIYDLQEQIALIASANLVKCKLNIFDAKCIKSKFRFFKRVVKQKISDNLTVFDVENDLIKYMPTFDLLLNYICKKKSFIKNLPHIKHLSSIVPRIFCLCTISISASVDLAKVVKIFSTTSSLDIYEREHISIVHALVALYSLSNTCECISSISYCMIKGYNDSKKQIFDLSLLDSLGYIFGLQHSNDIILRNKYNSVCKDNNTSMYAQRQNLYTQLNDYHLSCMDIVNSIENCKQSLEIFKDTVCKHMNTNFTQSSMSLNLLQLGANSREQNYSNYPNINVLTNGQYYSILDSQGFGFSVVKNVRVLKGTRFAGGIQLYANIDNKLYSLYDNCTHCQNSSIFHFKHNDITVDTLAIVLKKPNCEVRFLQVQNNSNFAQSLQVLIACNFDEAITVRYDERAQIFKIYQKGHSDFSFATLKILHQTVNLNNGNIVCSLLLDSDQKVDLIVELCMCENVQDDFELQKNQILLYQQKPMQLYAFESITLLVLSKLLYNRYPPFLDTLKVIGIVPDCHIVTLTVRGNNFLAFENKLVELKKLASIVRFNLIVFYSHQDRENQTLVKTRCLLDECNLLTEKCNIIVLNLAFLEKLCLSQIRQFCIDFSNPLEQNHSVEENQNRNLPGNVLLKFKDLSSRQFENHSVFDKNQSNDGLVFTRDNFLKISPTLTNVNDLWYNIVQTENLYTYVDQYGNNNLQHCDDNASFGRCGLIIGNEKNKLWSANIGLFNHSDVGAEYKVLHQFNKSVFKCDYDKFLTTLSISINQGINFNLQLQNKSDKKCKLAVMFFVDFCFDADRNISVVKEQNHIKVVDTFAKQSYYLTSMHQIDSSCIYKESFVNQYGAIIKNANLVDKGGVVPSVALSCYIEIKPYSTVATNFWFSMQEVSLVKVTPIKCSENAKLSVQTPDKKLNQFLARLNFSYLQSNLSSALTTFGTNYVSLELSRNILIRCAKNNTKDLYFIIALCRHLEFCDDKSILDCKVKKGNRNISLFEFCIELLNSYIFDYRGLVIRQDNSVILQDSLLLVWAIRVFSEYKFDTKPVQALNILADTITDNINDKCWKNSWYGLDDNIDITTQALAVLSQVADRQRGLKALDNLLDSLEFDFCEILTKSTKKVEDSIFGLNFSKTIQKTSSISISNFVLLIKALQATQQADMSQKILSNLNLNGNQNGSIFSKNFDVHFCLLYDCIIDSILGIKIKNKILKFEPKLPKVWDSFSSNIRVNGIQIKLYVENAKKQGGWDMSIDNIRHSINGLVLTSSLHNKQVFLKRNTS
ncbi:MAG: hypothetical protein LBU60_03380 [Clostridiales bacterium]|jgi:hypothetical protein|nr:hypothetical protein [Clostridiales bacterium]